MSSEVKPTPAIAGLARRRAAPRGFSLIELVMVMVTIGIISAIAAPRLSNAAQNAAINTLASSTSIFQKALEHYAAEHGENGPAMHNGSLDGDGTNFAARLLKLTNEYGSSGGREAIFGPYLRSIPRNPMNGLLTVRIDGAKAGAGTHGWRYDSATNRILPDDARGPTIIELKLKGSQVSFDGDKVLGDKESELAAPAEAELGK